MPPFPLTFQQLPGSNYPTNGAERRGKDWRDVDSGSEICRRCGTGDDDPTRAGAGRSSEMYVRGTEWK